MTSKSMSNQDIAELLRRVAAAYEIIGENRFKIIAYDRAADSIEHLTREMREVWDRGELDQIPGIGKGIAASLTELMEHGRVRHFEDVLSKVPEAVYPLLLIPGVGPKKAYRLVKELGLDDEKTVVDDLEAAAREGKVAKMEGFGDKSQEQLLENLDIYRKGQIKENRMLISLADTLAGEILEHLNSHPDVVRTDTLGSLRRRVATIGDLDIAAATDNPEGVIEHFLKYPHQKLVDRGPAGSTVLLHNGRQVDLRVQSPSGYGAMLQYFTGSKHHNIALRTYALEQGLSLSEHGIKNVKTGTVQKMQTEEDFYAAIGLPYIHPELREDMGEIDAAKKGALPAPLELNDLRGDLHIHTDYTFPTSHDIGSSHLHEYLDRATELGYEYIGISDHNPSIGGKSASEIASVMKKRKAWYEQQYYSWEKNTKKRVKMLLMCEVDILKNGELALPDKAFEYIDGAIVSLHSNFRESKGDTTTRILNALNAHPKVRVFGHPTGRLVGKRDGVDADWDAVFEVCIKRSIALEINAYPDRLDLPDRLVYDARRAGVKFALGTDSHNVSHMDNMHYGVSVARRGWAEASDIVTTLGYNEFMTWFVKD